MCVRFELNPFCDVILGALLSLAIILLRKRAGLFNCVVAVCVLCLFLTVPWVGLQSVFKASPGHITYFSTYIQ